MRPAKFRVTSYSRTNDFNKASEATVTIDRASMTVTVRPLRQHKSYGPVPLASIARDIILKSVLAEIREKKKAKAAQKGRFGR